MRRPLALTWLVSVSASLNGCTPSSPPTKDEQGAAVAGKMDGAMATRATVPQTHPLTLAASAGPATTLFVMLHGVGADAQSFHDIARKLAPSFPHADFVTPDGFYPFDQAPSGRQWFSIEGVTPANRAGRVRDAATEVSAWIDAQLDARKLPHERVIVVGFSQGAIVGSWLALHRTPSPLAIVMLSGRIGDDATPIANTVQTPVFWGHGSADARIPVAEQEPGAKLLEGWGARVTTHVYPGLTHSVDARELSDVVTFLQGLVP